MHTSSLHLIPHLHRTTSSPPLSPTALTTLNPPYPPGINPDDFNDGIMVLGTTNQPWLLEDDLRRIFTYNIHVKLPGEKAREELFRMFLQTLPHTLTDDHFKCLVAKSEG